MVRIFRFERRPNPRFQEPNLSFNLEAIEPFKRFAAARGVSPATLAIAWLLAKGDHLIPIPGTRSAAHLDELAAAAECRLSADDVAEVERILPIGFAHGNRYSQEQAVGQKYYC